MRDAEMFEHLNVEFDLHNGLVNVETMAKDNHGKPRYEYIVDTNTHNSVEIANDGSDEVAVSETPSFLDTIISKLKPQQ